MLVAVGSIVPRKNLSAAIELLSVLDDPALVLLIAGRQDDHDEVARLRARAETLGVVDRVRLVGVVPPAGEWTGWAVATAGGGLPGAGRLRRRP